VSLGLERRFDPFLTGGASFSVERANVVQQTTASTLTANGRTQHYALIGVPLYVKLDRSNDLLNPTRGYRAQANLVPYQSFSGPNLTFASGRLAAAGTGGSARATAISSPLPARSRRSPASRSPTAADKRIYAGGGGSVRAYGYQMAGPLDINNNPIGGKSALELSLEFRWKITDTIGIVPFVDAAATTPRACRSPARSCCGGRASGCAIHCVRPDPSRRRHPGVAASRRLADPGLYQPRPGLLMRGLISAIIRWSRRLVAAGRGGARARRRRLYAAADRAGARMGRRIGCPDGERPGLSVTVGGLGGTLPFDIRAERIEIGDEGGIWLTLRDVHIDLSATDLFSRRVRVRALTAVAIEVARLPQGGPAAAPSAPWSERVKLPRLPVEVTVERLVVERLGLAAGVLGPPMAGRVDGNAVMSGDTALIAIDLLRRDGMPGTAAFRLGLAGEPAILDLDLTSKNRAGRRSRGCSAAGSNCRCRSRCMGPDRSPPGAAGSTSPPARPAVSKPKSLSSVIAT